MEGDVDDLYGVPDVITCGVCYDDLVAEDEPRQIPKCEHIFCKSCLDHNIESQIGEGDEVSLEDFAALSFTESFPVAHVPKMFPRI